MDFVSQVMFNYNIHKGNICRNGQFSNLSDLLNAVRNSLHYNSFELVLTRTVNVIDKDSNPKKFVEVGHEKLGFIVADGLTYPNDVREFLNQKYNDQFGFDWQKLSDNNPVYFSGVLGIEELGPKDPKTGERKPYTRQYVECRQLNNYDVVVDKNLQQIWPIKTDKMPKSLVALLARKKEIIH